MIDWNRNGIIDPVDIGIDIAVQSAASAQEVNNVKKLSNKFKNSPLSSLFRKITKCTSKKKYRKNG